MTDQEWNAPIESARLVLSPLVPDDAGEPAAVLGDRSLYRFTGGPSPKADELRRRFEGWRDRRSPDGTERWLNWVIRDRDRRQALGTMQETVRLGDAGFTAQLAWMVRVESHGFGYASESARAVIGGLESRGVFEFKCAHPSGPRCV